MQCVNLKPRARASHPNLVVEELQLSGARFAIVARTRCVFNERGGRTDNGIVPHELLIQDTSRTPGASINPQGRETMANFPARSVS